MIPKYLKKDVLTIFQIIPKTEKQIDADRQFKNSINNYFVLDPKFVTKYFPRFLERKTF